MAFNQMYNNIIHLILYNAAAATIAHRSFYRVEM